MRENCPFCVPEITRSAWLETPEYRVIYNLAPIVPGHSMVIPKRHVASLLDLSEAELAGLFQLARRAVRVLLAEFQGTGFDLTVQDGEAAGQSIAHLHVHVVPRRPGDLPGQDWHEEVLDSASRPRLAPVEVEAMAARLRVAAENEETDG